MPNIFDSLEARIHRATTKRFGYDVSWLPSFAPEGTLPVIVRAHLKDPHKYGMENERARVDYGQQQPILEYYRGDFVGLMEAVNRGGVEAVYAKKPEHTWELAVKYEVQTVDKVHDGDTFAATLVVASTPIES